MSEHDDNLNYDEIDFNKTKRGKAKNGGRRVSLFVIEGLILLVVVVAGSQFLFRDTTEVTDLQATIDSQNVVATTNAETRDTSLSAEDLLNRAKTEIDAGEADSAMRSLDLALELNPTYADAYFERGRLNYDQSLYYSASQDFSQAIEYGITDPEFAYYWRGRANFQWDDFTRAESDFERVLDIDNSFTEAMYWRGRSRMKLAQYEQGIADVKQAVEMGYDEPAYAYFFIGNAYDDLEDYLSAITYYSRSIGLSVDDCEDYACWVDYNNRATAYYRMEMYDNAVEDYTKAIQVNPDEYPLALQNRGDAYERLDDMTAAMSDRNTMFQLVETNVINRSISTESNTLRVNLDTNETQAHITFDASVGDTVTLTVTVPDDSDLNTMMLLRDPNGSPVAYSSNPNDNNAQFEGITLTETGTYTVVVAGNLGQSSGEFTLMLE